MDTDFTRTNLLQTNKPSSKATVGLTDEKTAVEHTTEAEYTTQETLVSKTQVETEHKVNAGTGYIAWIVIGILVVIGLTVALVSNCVIVIYVLCNIYIGNRNDQFYNYFFLK